MGRHLARAEGAPVTGGDALAHAGALELATRGVCREGLARFVDKAPGICGRCLEGLGDSFVGEAAHLAQEKGRALGLREGLQVGLKLAKVLLHLELAMGVEGGGGLVIHDVVHRATLADHVDALVVGDPIEPGAHRELVRRRADQGAVGAQHRRLKGLLGIIRLTQGRATEAEERTAVALEEHLEGSLVATRDAPGEVLVGEKAEGTAGAAGDATAVCGVKGCQVAHL